MPSWRLRYRAGADPEAREYYDEVHDLRMDPYCTRLSAAEDPNQQGYVTVEVDFASPGPSNPRLLEILRRRDANNIQGVHFPSLSAVVEANTQGLRPGDIASVGPDGVVGTTGTPIGTVIAIEPDGNHVRVAFNSERNPVVRPYADRVEIAASELENITPHRFNIIESMQQRRSQEFQAEEDRRIFEVLDSVAAGEEQRPPRQRPPRAKEEPLPEPVRRTRFEKALDKDYIL